MTWNERHYRRLRHTHKTNTNLYFTISVECIVDPDCRTDQICHNNQCIDPCLLENPCAVNAICQGQNHAAICTCPAGLVGNPYVSCETVECYVNRDCDTTKGCFQNTCFDPCLLDNVCAPTAICTAVNHLGSCTCPPGKCLLLHSAENIVFFYLFCFFRETNFWQI